MTKPTKPVLRVLERIFAAEIEGRTPLWMRDSEAVRRAEKEGLVEHVRLERASDFGAKLIITGYELTHRGRYAYGCACKDDDA